MARNSNRHRTSISRFLRSDLRDNNALEIAIKRTIINTIYEESKRSGQSILCIIDDTILSKTAPSSKSKRPIEGAYFHIYKTAFLRNEPKRL